MIPRQQLGADWRQRTEVHTHLRKSLHRHRSRLGKFPEASHRSQHGQWLRTTGRLTSQFGKPGDTRLSNDPRRRNVGNGSLRYAVTALPDPLTSCQSSCHDPWRTCLSLSQARNHGSFSFQLTWNGLLCTMWVPRAFRVSLAGNLQTLLQKSTLSRRRHHPEQSVPQWNLVPIQLHVHLHEWKRLFHDDQYQQRHDVHVDRLLKRWHHKPCSSDYCDQSEIHWKIYCPATWRPWLPARTWALHRVQAGCVSYHPHWASTDAREHRPEPPLQCCVASNELNKIGFHPWQKTVVGLVIALNCSVQWLFEELVPLFKFRGAPRTSDRLHDGCNAISWFHLHLLRWDTGNLFERRSLH